MDQGGTMVKMSKVRTRIKFRTWFRPLTMDRVQKNVKNSTRNSIENSIKNSIKDSIRNSIQKDVQKTIPCNPSVMIIHVIFILNLLFSIQVNAMEREERIQLRDEAREMFIHGYDSYMKYAFPADELMPLSCKGRYRDVELNRGDLDDALGNFSLTLIDTLDSLVIFSNLTEFDTAVKLVSHQVTFDSDIVVSVFETNIRVLGGLLSGHVLANYVQENFKPILSWYKGELLALAKDIGYRLLPAFNTSTGIPHPRVNLKYGMNSAKIPSVRETCTACAGTIILEFGALSRLTGLPVFEIAARKAMDYLWQQRHRGSDLIGTILNIHNGDWVRRDAGVGAGVDSYYEYLLKAYILFGDEVFLRRFNIHYEGIMKYISQGPLLIDVHMHRPTTNSKGFMDSLLAFWPGLQVLKGDLKPAVETHEMLYQVMERHNYLMPEAFSVADFGVHWAQHLMRPEFVESTYFLFRATGDPHYLEVGKKVMHSLQKFTRTKCGFAAVKDVRTGSQEDRMDSFVLAETLKYLFLLFADKSDILINLDDFIFTTEAHILPLKLAVIKPKNGSILEPSGSSMEGGATVFTLTEDGEEDEQKYFHTCPSPHHLMRSGSVSRRKESVSGSLVYRDIRASLKDFVKSNSRSFGSSATSCPSHMKGWRRRMRITPEEFTASNPDHLEAINRMGIQVVLLSDGRIQLVHSVSAAGSDEEAEDGILFMQQMVAISKRQIEKSNEQMRIVSFESPKSGQVVSLSAGPAQFGPDLNTMKRITSGQVVKVDPYKGCTWPLSEESQVELAKGKIGIVERGDCMFVQKARHIQTAGGSGVIVIDTFPQTSASTGSIFAMSGDDNNDVQIPVVFLFGQEGAILMDVLNEYPDISVHLRPSLMSKDSSEEWDEEDDPTRLNGDSKVLKEGVAYVTEVTSDGKRKGSFKLNNFVDRIARGLSKKFLETKIGAEGKGTFKRLDARVMDEMLQQVADKTLASFREMMDDKGYSEVAPVINDVMSSIMKIHASEQKLKEWLEQLERQEKNRKLKLSANPLVHRNDFIYFITHGAT